jgi:hypothetical protein
MLKLAVAFGRGFSLPLPEPCAGGGRKRQWEWIFPTRSSSQTEGTTHHRNKGPKVEAALKEFVGLLRFFLKAEAKELPELEAVLDSFLDELQKKHGNPFQREQFSAYMMIQDSRTDAVRK